MVFLADWSDQVSPGRPVLQAIRLALLGCSLVSLGCHVCGGLPQCPPGAAHERHPDARRPRFSQTDFLRSPGWKMADFQRSRI